MFEKIVAIFGCSAQLNNMADFIIVLCSPIMRYLLTY